MTATSGVPLLQALAGAISARALYPASHPRVVRAVELLHEAVRRAAATSDQPVAVLSIGEDLVVQGRPERGDTLYQHQLRRALRRCRIESITFDPMVAADEVAALVAGLTGATPLAASAGVTLGRVQLAFGETAAQPAGGGATAERTRRGLAEHHLDAVGAALRRFVAGEEGALDGIDAVIWQLMEATARAGRVLLVLSPLGAKSDQLFRHAVHVCLLTLELARMLVIEGPVQHELGVAALLHDIGKERVAEPTTGATVHPDHHPELGAAHLASIDGIQPLAVVVAFEHHLRWDGAASFPRTARRPGFASQLVAVANSWEHLVAVAPWGPPAAQRSWAATRLREQAGGALAPAIVGAWLERLAAEPVA